MKKQKKKTYVAPEATPNDFTIALLADSGPTGSSVKVGTGDEVVGEAENVGFSKKFGTALWEDMK